MADPDNSVVQSAPKKPGGGCLRIFVLFVILSVGAYFGGLYSVKYYSLNCQGMTVSDCVFQKASSDETIVGGDGQTVEATGPYTYKGHSISMTANIPLDGGGVTGSVTGECSGKVSGTYDGNANGIISGTITGYCDLSIVPVPARATFQGIVNKDGKSVPISFDGSAAGFSHNGSLTLSY